MTTVLLVFAGGGLGSVARFLLGRWIPMSGFMPVGTLLANVAACFILGLAVALADQRVLMSPNMRLFWTAGFCGGFSTFSTFSHETLSMIQAGNMGSAAIYILASLVCCIVATVLGLYIGAN